jgi:hypothetical protein
MTAAEWEAAFRSQSNAEAESRFWLEAALVYQEAVAAKPEMSLEDRQRCLHEIVQS